MRLAAAAGVEIPLHGLVYAKDDSRAYFIKRFDREGRGRRLHVEDFAQLSGKSRDTKYNSSMEQVAEIVSQYCTFPQIEHKNLFRLTLVNFLIGNEDMHLKNFSVIESNGKVGLSPAYDLVNTSIAMKTQTEEVALPLRGKKKNISKSLLFDYYARERLDLRAEVVSDVVDQLRLSMSVWNALIDRSFLSESMRASYKELLHSRQNILGI
jgi:serine/threonine-protein kinase HipA